ncbi:Rieske 2Fe-2S domain-containing protein [Kluyvera georgiana]|uniref:Rieske 2Fe-2S domain-containing protein n=1 Tax=Kluyvera georgiana TaxID=73098 RepID=UPI000A985C62|nr:Rieske 2Fe-2S domain-containing protein [Kluyvera georgiana]
MDVNGRDIALNRTDEGIFASDNRCSHGNARLSDGFLENGEIECPLRQGGLLYQNRQRNVQPID